MRTPGSPALLRIMPKCIGIPLFMAMTACGTSPTQAACDVAPSATPQDCAAIRNLLLPEALPEARGNSHGDDRDAALLGYAIFFDARFSSNQTVRCASCHAPEDHFNYNEPLPTEGLGPVARNAPILLNAAYNTWQFWDGRADTLWAQPLFTFEAENEMNFTRLELAHAVAAYYGGQYEQVFGTLPDMSTWPARGLPGNATYDKLPNATKVAIDTLAANVGKCIEAYLRHVASGRGDFDAYLLGQTSVLSASAQRGIAVFARAGCLQCHNGPNFTDDQFHNLGVPSWPNAPTDTGRALGLVTVAASPFNKQGIYYDGTPQSGIDEAPADAAAYIGAFKTPSLRNLAWSAPYGHNGYFATLDEVVRFHLNGGGHGNSGFVGGVDARLRAQQLSSQDYGDLLAFLGSINGTYTGDLTVPPYWWDWPDG